MKQDCDEIVRQHKVFIDVLFYYQCSRWLWVRWVARKMQDEIMYRLAYTDTSDLLKSHTPRICK